ncbi:MAG: hypothetical protein DMG98_21980 [Acidobacteria bacterium]|nr:MAG: hypothetical protein DMG98_21980 [Acidobacteriota bacterium]
MHHAKGKEPVEMLQAIVNVIEELQKEYESEFLNAGYWARRMTEREWIVNHIAGQLRSHNGFALAALPYQHSPSFLAERTKWETRRARRQDEKVRAEQERIKRQQEYEKQETARRETILAPVLEHLKNCTKCTVEFTNHELQFSGPNFSGQVCEVGYALMKDVSYLHWRGHRICSCRRDRPHCTCPSRTKAIPQQPDKKIEVQEKAPGAVWPDPQLLTAIQEKYPAAEASRQRMYAQFLTTLKRETKKEAFSELEQMVPRSYVDMMGLEGEAA